MERKNSTMMQLFKGFSNYTDEEYKKIWKEAIIVVDTNILLNFYRYSEDTRKELFKILNNLKERLWIPYQVGKEYFNNKDKVMVSSYNEYDQLISSIKKHFQNAINEVNTRKNSQLKCKNNITDIIESSSKNIIELLDKEKLSKRPKFENNSIENEIFKLFNNSISEPFEENEYKKIKIEGQKRVENRIPPGYKDNDKEENGDYFIFYSLIKKAQEENKDIIFITDDVKEDWFNEINGEKHGGRYELLNEFYNETRKLLIIYTSDGFVKSYNKNIVKTEADEKMIDELVTLRRLDNLHSDQYGSSSFNKKELIERLYECGNKVFNISNELDVENLITELALIIKSSNISDLMKSRLCESLRNVSMLSLENNSETLYVTLRRLIDRIKLQIIKSEEKNEEEILSEIRYNYKRYIHRLEACRSEQRLNLLYRSINSTINRHIEHIKLNNNSNYILLSKLQKVKELLIEIAENDELVINVRKKIINDIQEIIDVMTEQECLIPISVQYD